MQIINESDLYNLNNLHIINGTNIKNKSNLSLKNNNNLNISLGRSTPEPLVSLSSQNSILEDRKSPEPLLNPIFPKLNIISTQYNDTMSSITVKYSLNFNQKYKKEEFKNGLKIYWP